MKIGKGRKKVSGKGRGKRKTENGKKLEGKKK